MFIVTTGCGGGHMRHNTALHPSGTRWQHPARARGTPSQRHGQRPAKRSPASGGHWAAPPPPAAPPARPPARPPPPPPPPAARAGSRCQSAGAAPPPAPRCARPERPSGPEGGVGRGRDGEAEGGVTESDLCPDQA
jgi:hypothetical protein